MKSCIIYCTFKSRTTKSKGINAKKKSKMHVCQYALKSPPQNNHQDCRSTSSLHRPSTQLDPSSQHEHRPKQSGRRSPRLRRHIPPTISSLQRPSNRPIKPLASSSPSDQTSHPKLTVPSTPQTTPSQTPSPISSPPHSDSGSNSPRTSGSDTGTRR